MKRRISAIGVLITLAAVGFTKAGCGAAPKRPPDIVTKEVKVAVAVSCVPDDLGPAPAYRVADPLKALRQARDGPTRYRLAVAALIERTPRLEALEGVFAVCRGAPSLNDVLNARR